MTLLNPRTGYKTSRFWCNLRGLRGSDPGPGLRKQKGLTQQALADALDLHITQLKRYEAGSSQPSLEAVKKIAQTLRVTYIPHPSSDDFTIYSRRLLRHEGNA